MSRFVLQLHFHWKDLSKLSSEWNIIKYFKPILNIKFKFSVVFLSKNTKKVVCGSYNQIFPIWNFPLSKFKLLGVDKTSVRYHDSRPNVCIQNMNVTMKAVSLCQWGPNYPLEHFNKNIVLHYKYVQNSHEILKKEICRALHRKPCLCN